MAKRGNRSRGRQGKKARDQEKNQANLSTMDQEQNETTKAASTKDSPAGFMIVDTGDGLNGHVPLESETRGDLLEIGTNPDQVMQVIDDYTDDQDVLDDFSERQELANGGDALLQNLMQHHSLSPEITGDDVDASWETANQAGEEAVGGSSPTPDQDIVEELGEALGVTYEDDEPLSTADKLDARDKARWELDPASADTQPDSEDSVEEVDDGPEKPTKLGDDDELSLLNELEDEPDLEDLEELGELDESVVGLGVDDDEDEDDEIIEDDGYDDLDDDDLEDFEDWDDEDEEE